jgi:hypothetical protein
MAPAPTYPDQIGGLDIYTAVIDDRVRNPRQFVIWLTSHGLPDISLSTRQPRRRQCASFKSRPVTRCESGSGSGEAPGSYLVDT